MDLYALPPEEFTAARDAAAKDDKALKALRKPTVSAWILNTLVRREAGLLEDLLALGPLLTDAHQHGNGDALRRLGEERRQLVATVTARALDLAGRPTSPAVRNEVESTLEAALADPASAEAVRSGQLLRPLTYAGFGGVDLEGSVAATRSPRPRSATTRAAVTSGGPDVAAEEAVALAAAGALDDAVRQATSRAEHVAAHAGQLAAARHEEQAATELVAAAEADLVAARRAAEALRKRRTGLEKEQEALIRRAAAASKAVAHAQDAADVARKALDKARRGP